MGEVEKMERKGKGEEWDGSEGKEGAEWRDKF